MLEFCPRPVANSIQEMSTSSPSMLREAARWGKRQHLAWKLDRASAEQSKFANAALNWTEFWHKQTRLLSSPRFIQVGTNWTCNLKCNFCRLTLNSTQQALKQLPKNELEISPTVLDSVLELMPKAEMITLTPLGEPLLYTKIGVILERHRQLGSRNLAMTTNANLINHDRARMLVEGGVTHLFVSIDSNDPDIYGNMRILGNLDRVEAALDSINYWKEKLHSELPSMTLASTFMERNVRQMPEMVDFAIRHRFISYSVQLMEVENPELNSEFLGNHLDLTREMVVQTLRRAEEASLDLRMNIALLNLLTSSLSLPELKKLEKSGNFVSSDEERINSVSTHGKHLTEKCHYPWYYLLIDTNGDCRPCCWAGSSYGNLNHQEFDAIWNGPQAITMRQDFLRNHIPKGCQHKHCRVDLDHPGTLE
jgi:MoaA/NifB/PqqE/SkfB family radical SAM enzyme